MLQIANRLRENAVIRFFLTYMAILVLAFVVCIAGFQRALSIVRENTIEENSRLLRQGVNEVENMLSDLYLTGMQMTFSDSLQMLGTMTSARDPQYYKTVKSVLLQSSAMLRYYDTKRVENMFIYVNSLDRVIYDNAVYQKSVFQQHPQKWGVTMGDWMSFCESDFITPHFRVSDSGQLFYVFPCLQSMQNKVKLGTILFRITPESVLGNLGFLKDYSAYSLFVFQKETVLMQQGSLVRADQLERIRNESSSVYEIDGHLALKMLSEKDTGLSYLLVLPQNEAMLKLRQLRIYIALLIFAAVLGGTFFAFFFSFRSGNPINKIAQMLHAEGTQSYTTDLKNISNTIKDVIEAQKQDKPALRKNFFHNLLKADFVSNTELQYMAARADIKLTDTRYYAAAIRLFPQIDADSIDGQTVEEARVLQGMIEEQLRQIYPGPLWSYKRNTLVNLYIIECQEEDALLSALQNVADWLRITCHVDAYWGIGLPCDDLMQFWKCAEEANSMLEQDGLRTTLRLYQLSTIFDDAYYLPYCVEERLMQGLRAGDATAVENALQMIQTENFVRRALGRKQFQKLNRRIADILSDQTRLLKETDTRLAHLQALTLDSEENCEAYFEAVQTLCDEICESVATQKNQQRGQKMHAILSFVEENYANPDMGLGMVSQQYKLSEGYLSSLFKAETDVNFADYLERLRTEHACALLKDGVLIADVAQKTGYNSVQSFRRAFKRVMGVSPSGYRG